jgi:hypothetical protein
VDGLVFGGRFVAHEDFFNYFARAARIDERAAAEAARSGWLC